MPIYEYICTKCDAEQEVIQKISDLPLTKCLECSDEALVKKASMSAFHLKGGGWYKDGYGDGKKKTDDTKAKAPKTSENTTKSDSSKSKPDVTPPKASESSKAKAS
ncbi:MAG: zinc ribbon domain-containing protein [Proteobacteria bacterium]|nr:zinc ribbon domain-containing protein [Pseudomonadota bacterium]